MEGRYFIMVNMEINHNLIASMLGQLIGEAIHG